MTPAPRISPKVIFCSRITHDSADRVRRKAASACDGSWFRRNLSGHRALMLQQWRLDVDHDTKREIVVLTLGTLAAVPVVTGIGLAVVAGLLAW